MNRVLAGRAIAPGVRSSTEFVRLSKWINEPYPPWAEILTAHDLARLTRRHGWMVLPPTRAESRSASMRHIRHSVAQLPRHSEKLPEWNAGRQRRGAICVGRIMNDSSSSPLRDGDPSKFDQSRECGIFHVTTPRISASAIGR